MPLRTLILAMVSPTMEWAMSYTQALFDAK